MRVYVFSHCHRISGASVSPIIDWFFYIPSLKTIEGILGIVSCLLTTSMTLMPNTFNIFLTMPFFTLRALKENTHTCTILLGSTFLDLGHWEWAHRHSTKRGFPKRLPLELFFCKLVAPFNNTLLGKQHLPKLLDTNCDHHCNLYVDFLIPIIIPYVNYYLIEITMMMRACVVKGKGKCHHKVLDGIFFSKILHGSFL